MAGAFLIPKITFILELSSKVNKNKCLNFCLTPIKLSGFQTITVKHFDIKGDRS